MPRCRAQHLGFEPLTSRPKLGDQRGQTKSLRFISCLASSCAGACSQPRRHVTCAQVIAAITWEREKSEGRATQLCPQKKKTALRPYCHFLGIMLLSYPIILPDYIVSFVSHTVMRCVSAAGSFSRTQEWFQGFKCSQWGSRRNQPISFEKWNHKLLFVLINYMNN